MQETLELIFTLDQLEVQAEEAFNEWQKLSGNKASTSEKNQAFEKLKEVLDAIGGSYGDTEEMKVRKKFSLVESTEN